jgi:hypothetical protein
VGGDPPASIPLRSRPDLALCLLMRTPPVRRSAEVGIQQRDKFDAPAQRLYERLPCRLP